MRQGYSWKKGFGKGVVSLLTFAAAGAAFLGFSDIALWDLVVTYIKPVLGTLTVGGLFAFAINFVKYNWVA